MCQNDASPFFITMPRLSQAWALLFPIVFCNFRNILLTMTKLHFRPYNQNQNLLFPQRIDENISQDDPVRILNVIVDSINIDKFKKLYKECGRSPYHPKMMLKVIIYAYMNNIYSCRRIEKLLLRDINFIWLSGYEKPDFITINRFRNRVKSEINDIFTQIVLILADKGLVSLETEYIDGTKIESKANKYTFVWRKNVERNRERLIKKIKVLLRQIDDSIAQDNADETKVEITYDTISDIISELKESLSKQPEPSDKESKAQHRYQKKQIKELESQREKLDEYDKHIEKLGNRNSYSKTDNDATFMRMKEDAMNNGQTKPGYNLQIATENQFITDFALFPNPTDTLTLIPLLDSFYNRYDRLSKTAVADSGYGSEENYRFMKENEIKAFVKYNYFHMEQRPRYKVNPFSSEGMYYNKKDDYYVCPMGQHMNRIETRRAKTASGYITESARYKAQCCNRCPLRGSCYKSNYKDRIIEVNHRLNSYKQEAKGLLTSEEGIKQRGRRCIEPEAVFGQMKYDMAYRRFRHFGKDKVNMDFAFFAIAFNLKKMCRKLLKDGYKYLYDQFIGSFWFFFNYVKDESRENDFEDYWRIA